MSVDAPKKRIKKKPEVIIALIGGPQDGLEIAMKSPYESRIYFQSQLRSDIQHVYEWDESRGIGSFPLIYRHIGFERL